MTRVSVRNNKARGKDDERAIARKFGAKRHPADVGGPEDCEHEWLAIQVKGGLRVINSTVRQGVDSARVAAVGTTKLPICVVRDRSGTRVRDFVVLDASDFLAWHGIGGETRHPRSEPWR
jgi:hypothetical protein